MNNCMKCQHYNSDFNFMYCNQCGAPNPDNPGAVQGQTTLLTSEAPRVPILVQDKYVEGVGIEIVQMGVINRIEAGALLAIVPHKGFNSDNLDWYLILRRPVGDEITKLRKLVAENAEASLKKLDEKTNLERELKKEKERGDRFSENIETCSKQADEATRERNDETSRRQKLEAHIGAIREAIGNKQMDDILKPLLETGG